MPPLQLDERGTPMPFGKYSGRKSIEELILFRPEYIWWLTTETKLPWNHEASLAINCCIRAFDDRPLVVLCQGACGKEPCRQRATRAFLLDGSLAPYFFCDGCDPQLLYPRCRPVLINGDRSALHLSQYLGSGLRCEFRNLVKALFEAKGLVGRKTRQRILDFLHNLPISTRAELPNASPPKLGSVTGM